MDNDLPGRIDLAPLWNGKSLDGWETSGGAGVWKIKDGVLRGTSGKEEPRHSMLLTKKKYQDFVLSIEFLAKQGNSGLCFRAVKNGEGEVVGLQADINPDSDTGGLYEMGGRKWIVQPTADEVKQWYLRDQWNKMTVVAQGGDIKVYVNGTLTADVHDDPGRAAGHIGLQMHGGEDMDIAFRNIRIAELKPTTDQPGPSLPQPEEPAPKPNESPSP